jgi:hypothetical protein
MVFVTAVSAHAGSIHPYLQAKMDATPRDQPISVIVHMVEQAPIPSLNSALHRDQATRQERHREVIEALQSSGTRNSLRDALDTESRRRCPRVPAGSPT